MTDSPTPITTAAQAIEAAAKSCLDEMVDYTATGDESDRAYNQACSHCHDAIRALTARLAPPDRTTDIGGWPATPDEKASAESAAQAVLDAPDSAIRAEYEQRFPMDRETIARALQRQALIRDGLNPDCPTFALTNLLPEHQQQFWDDADAVIAAMKDAKP